MAREVVLESHADKESNHQPARDLIAGFKDGFLNVGRKEERLVAARTKIRKSAAI